MANLDIKERLDHMKYSLPTEIWEIVLYKLAYYPRSIIAASEVCKQWRHLATRICRKYCTHHLDERLLIELFESAVAHKKAEGAIENEENYVQGEEWIKAFWLYNETNLDSSQDKENDIVHIFESVVNITSADPYLSISSYNENKNLSTVKILNALHYPLYEEFNGEKHTAKVMDSLTHLLSFDVEGKVFKVCVLTLPTPVLLIITTEDTKAILLPKMEVTNRTQPMFTNPRIKGHPRTSVEGRFILTQRQEDEENLLLYEASLSPDDVIAELNLELKFSFKTESSTYSWILARGLVATMETSGHIRTYQINARPNIMSSNERNCEDKVETVDGAYLWGESCLKKDLRYPNPTLFTKDFLFSSTLVSRDLLGYWHMDRDRDYWLIGCISPEVLNKSVPSISSPATISLHQVMLGQEVGEVITALIFERGILVCGTKAGHILCYKLRPKLDFTDEGCFKDFTGLPWLTVSGVTTKAISRLGCLFTPVGMLVAAWEDVGQCSLIHIPLENRL